MRSTSSPRSSTMPLNDQLSSTPSTPGSLAGSTYSMAGIKSLSSSKAARLGLQRRGKDLLSSAWTSLSPAGSKAPKEALSSLKTWSFSAATNLSKKYEEMRDSVVQSPAAQVTIYNLNPHDKSLLNRKGAARGGPNLADVNRIATPV